MFQPLKVCRAYLDRCGLLCYHPIMDGLQNLDNILSSPQEFRRAVESIISARERLKGRIELAQIDSVISDGPPVILQMRSLYYGEDGQIAVYPAYLYQHPQFQLPFDVGGVGLCIPSAYNCLSAMSGVSVPVQPVEGANLANYIVFPIQTAATAPQGNPVCRLGMYSLTPTTMYLQYPTTGEVQIDGRTSDLGIINDQLAVTGQPNGQNIYGLTGYISSGPYGGGQ